MDFPSARGNHSCGRFESAFCGRATEWTQFRAPARCSCLRERHRWNRIFAHGRAQGPIATLKNEGQPPKAALVVSECSRCLRQVSRLRQVVAERSPEHIVVALRAAARVGGTTRARPEIALKPGVLQAHPHSTLRTAIE